MLVVMHHEARPAEIDRVVQVINEMGYEARPMPGAQRTAIGVVGNDGRVDSSRLSALPGVVRQGKVTYVYPTVNPETRTARIRVELANPDLALKPGMYGTIRFSAPTDSVLSVPRSAVLATGERNFVFVRSAGGQFVPHEVTLGAATAERVAILAGLGPGDTVVRSGTFLVEGCWLVRSHRAQWPRITSPPATHRLASPRAVSAGRRRSSSARR